MRNSAPMENDLLFQATVLPHRSLSRRGRTVLLTAIGAACLLNVGVSAWLRAWPVSGFGGVELLLAIVLLRMNANRARDSEVLLLTPDALRIQRTDTRGARQEVTLEPAWMRVEMQERPGRVPALYVTARGRREEIARSLGETEKRDLAEALAAALHSWRNPRFDAPPAA
jgi:uncharacterized membrane protein